MRSAVIRGRLARPSFLDNPWAGYSKSSASDPVRYACAVEGPQKASIARATIKWPILFIALAAVLALSGCGGQELTGMDLAIVESECSDRDGVEWAYKDLGRSRLEVRCKDGTHIYPKPYK